MATLLIKLSAPMQSWGIQSRFTERDTTREPTKSGIVGLLCAALGWKRDHDLSPFSPENMLMGVRVEREGNVQRDYHITQNVIKQTEGTTTVVSNRYFLSDAEFIVGLESKDIGLLNKLKIALENPIFPLFLGRKAFPPASPLIPTTDELGFENPTELNLKDALKNAFYIPRSNIKPPEKIRLVLEISPEDPDYLSKGIVRIDQPISFEKREFQQRYVYIDYCEPNLKRS